MKCKLESSRFSLLIIIPGSVHLMAMIVELDWARTGLRIFLFELAFAKLAFLHGSRHSQKPGSGLSTPPLCRRPSQAALPSAAGLTRGRGAETDRTQRATRAGRRRERQTAPDSR